MSDTRNGMMLDATSYGAGFFMLPTRQLGGVSPANTWLGDTGASGNGDWNTAADWGGGTVPAASATVTFATGNTGYTVTGDASAAGIVVDGDGVTFTGNLTQSGTSGAFLTALDFGQVTIGPDAFVTGGGIVFGAGTLLDVQGTLVGAGGTADTLLVDAPGAQFINSGAVQLNALYAQNGGTYAGDLVLNDGGNITFDTASNVSGGSVTLLNSGLIYAADIPGGNGGPASFADDVTISTTTGYLELASDPGVTLTMDGTISGGGFLLVSGGTVELSGANAYAGGTVVRNGTLVADSYGSAGGNPIFVQDGGFTANVTQLPAASVSGGVSTETTGTITATPILPAPFSVVAIGTDDTVTAAAGRTLVFGSQTGTLTFIGGSASSTLIGGSGIVHATGGANDLIVGGTSGKDVLSSGGGASVLVGGSNGDTLVTTGAGTGTLVSGGGTTTMNLVSSTGTDTLFGGAQGSQTNVLGGAGTANVILGSGDATIYASSGTLNVFAGSGALSLDFVAGQPGGGVLNVVGFDTTADHIVLTGYAPGTAAAVFAGAQVADGNTILTLTNGSEVVLFGVTNLTSANVT